MSNKVKPNYDGIKDMIELVKAFLFLRLVDIAICVDLLHSARLSTSTFPMTR